MSFTDRPVVKLLTHWRENYGLAMTAHLLVTITGMPWSELREELHTEVGGSCYRMLHCPDIGAPVFYVDWPVLVPFDRCGAVALESQLMRKVDEQMEDYPPSEGYVGVRGDQGHKALWFRDVAREKKGTTRFMVSPEQIMEDLRSVWQRVSAK